MRHCIVLLYTLGSLEVLCFYTNNQWGGTIFVYWDTLSFVAPKYSVPPHLIFFPTISQFEILQRSVRTARSHFTHLLGTRLQCTGTGVCTAVHVTQMHAFFPKTILTSKLAVQRAIQLSTKQSTSSTCHHIHYFSSWATSCVIIDHLV